MVLKSISEITVYTAPLLNANMTSLLAYRKRRKDLKDMQKASPEPESMASEKQAPSTSKWIQRKASFKSAIQAIKSISTASPSTTPGNEHKRVYSVRSLKGKPHPEMADFCQSKSVPRNIGAFKMMETTASGSTSVTSPASGASLASTSEIHSDTNTDDKKPEKATFDVSSSTASSEFGSEEELSDILQEKELKSRRLTRYELEGTQCTETLINTLLNRTTTQQGQTIRKQLSKQDSLPEEEAVDESSSLFPVQRPILTIEPPSPMPDSNLSPPDFKKSMDQPGSEESPETSLKKGDRAFAS